MADPRDVTADVAEIARRVVGPEAARTDAEARWPETGLRALQEAGLTGLLVPEEFGGRGGGAEALARASEVLAAECASTALCFAMHGVACAVLAHAPSDDQADRYLRPIAAGEHLSTLSLSEAGTGSHFWIPGTTSTSSDGGFRLDGGKDFVTNGGHADSYVVSARDGGTVGLPSFSCFVVPSDATGLEWGEDWTGLGMRGNSSRSLRLDGVTVPGSALLGREGDQVRYVFGVIAPTFLVAMAGTYLGVARHALDLAADHLRARRHEHDGRALADVAVLQHRLGVLWSSVERSRALTFEAGRRIDEGEADAMLHAASAKVEATNTVLEVANEAMGLVGGQGYRSSAVLARCLRDARAAPVMSPTTDLLLTWLGRSKLGLPILDQE